MSIAEISTDQLAEYLTYGARLVDVRNPDEYTGAHVPGAVLVPLSTVPDNVESFRGDGPTYVICKVGGRSRSACAYLVEQGLDVVNVAGGTDAWIASGRGVVTGQDPV